MAPRSIVVVQAGYLFHVETRSLRFRDHKNIILYLEPMKRNKEIQN